MDLYSTVSVFFLENSVWNWTNKFNSFKQFFNLQSVVKFLLHSMWLEIVAHFRPLFTSCKHVCVAKSLSSLINQSKPATVAIPRGIFTRLFFDKPQIIVNPSQYTSCTLLKYIVVEEVSEIRGRGCHIKKNIPFYYNYYNALINY